MIYLLCYILGVVLTLLGLHKYNAAEFFDWQDYEINVLSTLVSVFWPVLIIATIAASPLYAIYKLSEYINNKE